jgi:arylsulfatase A-like enzyme
MKHPSLALLLLAPLGTLRAAEPVPAPARPNILWLVSEDNGRFLGCYGDTLAKTPVLDKLAREGILFEKCYTQPVCAPSRFSLITGLHPASCGPAQHMRAQGKIPAWLKGFPAYLKAAGYYTSNCAKTDYNSPIRVPEAWSASGKNAHWRGRVPGQPFFSVFNHEVTHESCLFPENERSSFDPASLRIPPYQPDTPEIRADWARYYDHMAQLDGQVGAKLKDLESAMLAGDTIVFYFADNGGVLPRSKRFLQDSGTHVPLIVYFPPKWRHLAPAAPGSRIADPVHFVDFAPTILSLAGVKIPDYMQGHAFAGPAKAAANEFVFCSRDRMDERYDLMLSVVDRRWLYIRNYRPDLPYVQSLQYMFQARGYQSWSQAARTGRLTPATMMFWGGKPAEELYDTQNDPDNIRNLATDPARRDILERMRGALEKHVIATNDNGFLPEGSALEGYDASRVPGAYPVGRVLALANLASERDPGNLPKLIEALEDPSEPIRWWAAQGCAMLREKAAPAAPALRRRLADPSAPVQIAAAEALARLGQVETALPVLARWIRQDGHPAAILHAANVIDRLGETARPLLPELKLAQENAGKLAGAAGTGEKYQVRILSSIIDVLEGRVQPLAAPAK